VPVTAVQTLPPDDRKVDTTAHPNPDAWRTGLPGAARLAGRSSACMTEPRDGRPLYR
jgi:hypothetical protein